MVGCGRIAACLSFVMCIVLLRSQGTMAETMCLSSNLLFNPTSLTTLDYPIPITAVQCACTIIPSETIPELSVQLLLRRGDRKATCDQTQITILHRNVSTIICPIGADSGDISGYTESLSLSSKDRPVITLWNTQIEFITAKISFSSEEPVSYNVSCRVVEGQVYWPFADQGLGFEDGIDPGIKVAIVVLFFILAALISTTVRLVMRIWWRQAKFERRRQRARQQRVDQLKQAQAFDNLGLSRSSLNQSSSSYVLVLHNGSNSHQSDSSYDKIQQNGIVAAFPIVQTENGFLKLSASSVPLTGQGCMWPVQDENRTSSDSTGSNSYPNVFFKINPIVHSQSSQLGSSAGNGNKPVSKYHQMSSGSSSASTLQAKIAKSASSKNSVSLGDGKIQTRSVSETLVPGGQELSKSASLASVHTDPLGRTRQKNQQIGQRNPGKITGNGDTNFGKDFGRNLTSNLVNGHVKADRRTRGGNTSSESSSGKVGHETEI